MLLFPLSAVGLAHSSTSLVVAFLERLNGKGPLSATLCAFCHCQQAPLLPSSHSPHGLGSPSLILWNIKENDHRNFMPTFGKTACAAVLWMAVKGERLKSLGHLLRAEQGMWWLLKEIINSGVSEVPDQKVVFFDGTPVSNCKLLVKWAERRKDDEAINRKGRWVQGCCFD